MKKTIIAAAVAAVFSASAMAQNMGFEDGNTTGWTSTTLSAVGSTTTQAGPNTWVISPYGNYMGRLQIQSGNYNQMATALGLTSASSTAITSLLQQQAQVSGGSPNPTTAGWVTREVTLTAGQTFTLAWQYVSVDYVPFNDGSIATLTQNGTDVATVNNYQQQYALLGFTNPGTGDYSTGSYGATGWQVATFQVSVDGTYTLGFGVFNLGDTALSPVLYIDEVQGTTTLNGQPFGAVAPNNATAPAAPSVTPPAPTTVSSVASGTTVDTSNLASAVTVNGGTIQIATNNVTLTNTFTADANGMTVDQNGNTSTFNGVISGSGGVTIANSGTGGGVTFAAVNTYTGPTTVNSGANLTNTGTIAGTVTNLGSFTNTGTTGNVTNGFNGDGNTASLVNSGTVGNVTNWSSFANSGTTGNVTNFGTFTNTGDVATFNNAGVLNNNAGGTINELGYNNFWVVNNGTINTVSYNGGTVNNHGTIGTINNQEAHGTFQNFGTVTGDVTTPSTFNNYSGGSVLGNYVNDGTLNNAGTLTTVTNNSTFNNNVGGVVTGLTTNTGTLNNSGTLADVTNNGTFNYNGGTVGNVINNGTLDISNNTENSDTVGNTTIYYSSVTSISGNGAVQLGDKYLVINNGNNNTYGGTISGTGGIGVESGTQTLSGNNTYTGATVIAEPATLNNIGTLVGDVLNAGTFNNDGTAGGIANAGTTTNNGTAGAVINTETGTFNNNGTSGDILNAGVFNNYNLVSGTVINSSTGTFTNSGTTGTWTNSGTMSNTGTMGNGTNLADATFTNDNIVGTVNNQGTFTNNGTTGTVTNSGWFTNALNAVVGFFTNSGTAVNNGNTQAVNNSGTFTNNGNSLGVNNSGTFTNAGTTGEVMNTGSFTNNGTVGVVHSNQGTFTNNGTAGDVLNEGTFNNAGTTGNWINELNSIITNSGTMANGTNHGTYTNTGTVGNVANQGSFTNNSGATSGNIVNSGVIVNNGTIGNINNTLIFTNNQNAQAGDVTNSGMASNQGTTGAVTNSGLFVNQGTTGNVVNDNVFLNSGTIGTITNNSSFINSGNTGNWTNNNTVVNTGSMGNGSNIGNFSNLGTVGNVANTGTFDNLGNTGIVTNSNTFNYYGGTLGGYNQQPTGITNIEHGAPIAVTGSASLGGSLIINDAPTKYGRYDVLSAGSVSGTYREFTSNGVNDYLKYSGTGVKLYVTPPAAATQSSIDATKANLANAINLQSNAVTSALGNDCAVFGESGACVSASIGQSKAGSGDLLNGGLTVAKKVNDNWRVGVTTNAPFNNPTVGNVSQTSNPAYGVFATWTKDQLSIQGSAAFNQGTMTITRQGPEVGVGKMSVDNKAYQLRANYAVPVNETVTVTPYVGIRYVESNYGGFTEQGPEFPLTVNSTKRNNTSAIAGVTVAKQMTEKLSGNVSLGITQNLSGQSATFTGTSEIGGLSTFNGTLPTNGRTNPSIGAGLSYGVDKTTKVGVNVGVQQKGNNANVSSVGITLTKGF